MADLIALEWNHDHIRVVTATTKSRGCSIEHIETIPLNLGEEAGKAPSSAQDLGERIGAIARRVDASKAAALVAVSRAQSELRLMNVPPAPDNELPDIVRFQAMQQFTSLSENCPLDFALTGESPGGARQIVAAAISSTLMKRIQTTVNSAGLTLRGVILRPCGTIAAVRKQLHLNSDEVCIVVDRLGDEAELTAIDDSAIMMARSVRLPTVTDDSSKSELLAAEVRRTLVAARTQLGGRQISGIVVCGPLDDAERAALEQIGLPVESVNPFAHSVLSKSVQHDMSAADAERYAPLLGLLQQEAAELPHEIDFLRPRRPAPPIDRRKFWTTVTTVALTALLLLGAFVTWRLSALDNEIVSMRRDSARRDKLVQVAERQTKYLDDVDDWLRSSPNWLLELRRLSQKLPDGDRLQLDQFQATLDNSGGGSYTIKGMVNQSATVSQLETTLRDGQHAVRGLDRELVGENPKYPWHFTEQIRVEPAEGMNITEELRLQDENATKGAAR